MASKLKQLWWLMLIFAICNIAIAIMLYQEPVEKEGATVGYIE